MFIDFDSIFSSGESMSLFLRVSRFSANSKEGPVIRIEYTLGRLRIRAKYHYKLLTIQRDSVKYKFLEHGNFDEITTSNARSLSRYVSFQ